LNKVASPRKMLVIHNGVNADDYHFLERNVARKELGLNQDGIIIGTIASLYPTKGLTYLIQASVKLTSQIKSIAIIGAGPEQSKLSALATELKADKIIFIGEKTQAEQYLKAFDLFVLPSVKEGLPYAILEAGLAEVPVVSTNVGGIPEIIDHDKEGLIVEPANPEQLAKAIDGLLADKKTAREYAQALKQKVETEFSLSSMLDKTNQLYEKLFPANPGQKLTEKI